MKTWPWLSAGQAEVEIPWWTYGPQGMQMWFPSSLAEPLSPSTREAMSTISTDPELEFDREVYPIGISIAEVAIIGEQLNHQCAHPSRCRSSMRLLSQPKVGWSWHCSQSIAGMSHAVGISSCRETSHSYCCKPASASDVHMRC